MTLLQVKVGKHDSGKVAGTYKTKKNGPCKWSVFCYFPKFWRIFNAQERRIKADHADICMWYLALPQLDCITVMQLWHIFSSVRVRVEINRRAYFSWPYFVYLDTKITSCIGISHTLFRGYWQVYIDTMIFFENSFFFPLFIQFYLDFHIFVKRVKRYD